MDSQQPPGKRKGQEKKPAPAETLMQQLIQFCVWRFGAKWSFCHLNILSFKRSSDETVQEKNK